MVTFSSTAEDPLEQGACIVLTHLELVPLNIGYFWSAGEMTVLQIDLVTK